MDNSAVAEAITADGILHWLVVSVGINAQTVYFAMTEIKAGTGDGSCGNYRWNYSDTGGN